MKNLLSRSATGLLILLLSLVVIFSRSRLLLFVGVLGVTTICLEEVFHAFYPYQATRYRYWGLALNLFANLAGYLSSLHLFLGVWAAALLLLFAASTFQPHKSLQHLMQVLFAVNYITLLFCFVYLFPRDKQTYLFLGILIAWGTDSCAYLIGSLFGKTHFTEISPHKTLEGCAGGVVGALVLCGLAQPFFSAISLPAMLLLAAIGSVVAQWGDVFASSLKRRSGIKDFSHILRSHGGFVDRFDSLIFTIPYLWIALVHYLLK